MHNWIIHRQMARRIDLPQIKMMYLKGIKYSIMVATASTKQARPDRKGTLQLNVLWNNGGKCEGGKSERTCYVSKIFNVTHCYLNCCLDCIRYHKIRL